MHSMHEYNVCNDRKCTKNHFCAFNHSLSIISSPELWASTLRRPSHQRTGLWPYKHHGLQDRASRILVVPSHTLHTIRDFYTFESKSSLGGFYAWKSHCGKSSPLNLEAPKVFLFVSKSKAYKVFRPKIFFVHFRDYAHVHAPSHNPMQHHDYEC